MSCIAGVWHWPNVPKTQWGPPGWRWLHSLAIGYPMHPDTAEARMAFRRVWNFVTQLPCAECRRHAVQFVMQHPPNLANTISFQRWAWYFHNSVNVRCGRRPMCYREYHAAYAGEIRRAAVAWAGRDGPRES